MRVVVTGANGFLGWHVRVRARALTDHEVVPVAQADWSDLARLVAGADAVVHLAGVNRGPDELVEMGNARLAEDLVRALKPLSPVPAVVFANSIQAGNGTPYGRGKERAAEVLATFAASMGAPFTDVRLPNLFGEHGRPDYSSFVATFTHLITTGQPLRVADREVELLHAQAAAEILLSAVTDPLTKRLRPTGEATTVVAVRDTLQRFFEAYQTGDIPALGSRLESDLFNVLRAAMFPASYPIPLVRRTDPRGWLVETVRCLGGEGQTFISSTKPGITRGQHFHLRKMERFVVVSGTAEIALRRVATDDTAIFAVSGEEPVIVDMPTLWTHNITNTGDDDLITMFWTNEIFNPDDADTHPEEV